MTHLTTFLSYAHEDLMPATRLYDIAASTRVTPGQISSWVVREKANSIFEYTVISLGGEMCARSAIH
jgi:hypothetical protein